MSAPPTVCFVATASPDEDLAGGPMLQATALARRGWSVHLLACAEKVAVAAEGGEPGVVVHRLDEVQGSPGGEVQRYGGDDPAVVLGELAQSALEVLHAQHRFDLVEFSDAAVAMRSVQSKRSAAAFLDVPLAVRLRAPAFRRRAEELRSLGAPRELKLDFCERYAFEHADAQSAAASELLNAVARRGWKVRPDAAPVPRGGNDGEADREVEDFYLARLGRSLTPIGVAATGSLTIVVAHYNHERYLATALASLATQTRPPEEVIVIDDGSTSTEAVKTFARQERLYPSWRFIRQENVGPGATRNRGLELATGTYFLPFDSDNVAAPTMVEDLVGAMERNPDRTATTCHNLGFTEDEDIAAGRFVSRYSPTGGPLVLSAVENVIGDTCSIFRTKDLRSVGGFEVNLWSPTEDWETFVKMVTRGLEVDVLPRPLFYYRTDAGGRLQHLGTDRGTKLRLRAHLLDEFFATAAVDKSGLRELFESLQAFEDFISVRIEEVLAERRRWHDAQMAELRRWHDAQMADLNAFHEERVEATTAELGGRADAADARVAIERARAEAAERELAALRDATSGPILGRAVRWRAR